MWIHQDTQTVFPLHSEIRSFFKNVSFPLVMTDDDRSSVGVFPVSVQAMPDFDRLTHRCVIQAPELVDSQWIASWSVEPLSESEKAAALAAAISEIEAAIDAHLDSVAQSFRFADRTRLALRAAYPNPWQALGIAFGSWMDNCNALAAQGLQDVLDGNIPLQTPDQVIAQLPAFVAP